MSQEGPRAIEQSNQKKFQDELDVYGIDKGLPQEDYFRKLTETKLNLVRKYSAGKKVLDLGCAGGDYLFELKDIVAQGHGVDYTDKAIEAANQKKKSAGVSHLEFLKANVRQLPFEDAAFDVVFSFSTLAVIPQVGEVVREVYRVLKNDGIAILEFGNIGSLNEFVCKAYPEYVQTCHISLEDMKKMFPKDIWKVLEWRSFGILPFWGERPSWLKLLLAPGWKKLFRQEIRAKMLDERVSNIFRSWAFRQWIVCRKI